MPASCGGIDERPCAYLVVRLPGTWYYLFASLEVPYGARGLIVLQYHAVLGTNQEREYIYIFICFKFFVVSVTASK